MSTVTGAATLECQSEHTLYYDNVRYSLHSVEYLTLEFESEGLVFPWINNDIRSEEMELGLILLSISTLRFSLLIQE